MYKIETELMKNVSSQRSKREGTGRQLTRPNNYSTLTEDTTHHHLDQRPKPGPEGH